jgi:uncharacterized repeat protein (TIGR03943 family)
VRPSRVAEVGRGLGAALRGGPAVRDGGRALSERRGQGAMLLAVGSMAVFLGHSDLTLSYVRAGIRPPLLASGVVLLALGAAAAFPPPRLAGRAAHGSDGASGDGAHGADASGVAWLLVVPLLVLILVAPPALGSYAAGQRSVPVAYWFGGHDASFPPVAEAVGGAVPMDLSEFYYRALYDRRRSLGGVRVRLLGFVTPRHDGGATYLLARFSMFCCAADAEVIEVAVHGDSTPRAAEQWLLVEGHWVPPAPTTRGHHATDALPVLTADSVTPVAPPRDRYEHSLFGY